MMQPNVIASGALFTFVLASVGPAAAQDRPFVFSMTTATPSPDGSRVQTRFDYDVGVGEQTFRTFSENGPEQRLGVQLTTGRWTFAGRFGIAAVGTVGEYDTSQQGEILYSIMRPAVSGMSLGIGGGVLREPGGGQVLLARAAGGHEATTWRLLGNLLLQKPLIEERDAVDLITSVGWARKVGGTVSVGAEAIGEDLEGFWEANEAEGGARLLIGPSLHIAPAARSWQLSAAGGPTLRPTRSHRASDALRDLPATIEPVGYAFKLAFSASF